MKVVEIGCGDVPGPFFEGADVHYIVDANQEALALGARDPAFTPLMGADGRDLGLPDASVGIVVARNVFGDPELGVDKETQKQNMDRSLELIASKGLETYYRLVDERRDVIHSSKLAIVQEAARVLVVGGKLIAVEQQTPYFAARFFDRVKGSPSVTSGLEFERTTIAAHTPASYAAVHQKARTDCAWVAIKH